MIKWQIESPDSLTTHVIAHLSLEYLTWQTGENVRTGSRKSRSRNKGLASSGSSFLFFSSYRSITCENLIIRLRKTNVWPGSLKKITLKLRKSKLEQICMTNYILLPPRTLRKMTMYSQTAQTHSLTSTHMADHFREMDTHSLEWLLTTITSVRIFVVGEYNPTTDLQFQSSGEILND